MFSARAATHGTQRPRSALPSRLAARREAGCVQIPAGTAGNHGRTLRAPVYRQLDLAAETCAVSYDEARRRRFRSQSAHAGLAFGATAEQARTPGSFPARLHPSQRPVRRGERNFTVPTGGRETWRPPCPCVRSGQHATRAPSGCAGSTASACRRRTPG